MVVKPKLPKISADDLKGNDRKTRALREVYNIVCTAESKPPPAAARKKKKTKPRKKRARPPPLSKIQQQQQTPANIVINVCCPKTDTAAVDVKAPVSAVPPPIFPAMPALPDPDPAPIQPASTPPPPPPLTTTSPAVGGGGSTSNVNVTGPTVNVTSPQAEHNYTADLQALRAAVERLQRIPPTQHQDIGAQTTLINGLMEQMRLDRKAWQEALAAERSSLPSNVNEDMEADRLALTLPRVPTHTEAPVVQVADPDMTKCIQSLKAANESWDKEAALRNRCEANAQQCAKDLALAKKLLEEQQDEVDAVTQIPAFAPRQDGTPSKPAVDDDDDEEFGEFNAAGDLDVIWMEDCLNKTVRESRRLQKIRFSDLSGLEPIGDTNTLSAKCGYLLSEIDRCRNTAATPDRINAVKMRELNRLLRCYWKLYVRFAGATDNDNHPQLVSGDDLTASAAVRAFEEHIDATERPLGEAQTALFRCKFVATSDDACDALWGTASDNPATKEEFESFMNRANAAIKASDELCFSGAQ